MCTDAHGNIKRTNIDVEKRKYQSGEAGGMKDTDLKVEGKKKSSRLIHKIFVPMICLVVLQVMIFVAALTLGGEFSYMKINSYNALTEKTQNRANYVSSCLNQTAQKTVESAEEIKSIINQVLEDENKTAADILTDKALDKKIIEASAGSLVELIQRGAINDAFLILESDSIYDGDDSKKRMGLYMRDTDAVNSNGLGKQDIYLEMGSSEIARDIGLPLDYEWSLYADVTDTEKFKFYYETLEVGRSNLALTMEDMGHWSEFSRISNSAQDSFKYTIPLIGDDGTVYGVVGIGLLEKTIQRFIPSNDFLNESACYLLAVDNDNNGVYSMIMHTGPAYGRLLEDGAKINQGNLGKYGVYDFSGSAKIDCVGSISDLKLYNSISPFNYQKWALISVADKDMILVGYITILQTLVVSLGVSLVISIVLSMVISRAINSPVKKMICTLDESKGTTGLVEFAYSGISEFDALAMSIKNLQAHIVENSSRVSKIISMAGSQVGVFMYDIAQNQFFVGESLIHLLHSDVAHDGDIFMTEEQFWQMISKVDSEGQVKRSRLFTQSESGSETIRFAFFDAETGDTRWIVFNMYRDAVSVICLAKDITESVIEKRKIEYERDYDITTGLLNRRAFYYKLGRIFSERDRLKTAACFMFDLDNLKYVNDTYGHDFGDEYIRTAAGVFRLFEAGNSIVARLSGDEFIIFMYGYNSQDEIRAIKDNIKKKLHSSFCILPDGSQYKMRASGGIAWYPQDAVESDMLIKYADFAMYTIKHSTKGNIGEFDKEKYVNDAVLVTGIEELNRIIDEGSIRYAFQSIVSVKTGEVYGYEALMRPVSEILNTPLEFIRIAKADAKMNEVERLTWVHALTAFKVQREQGNIKKNERIFLNTIPNCMIDKESVASIEAHCRDCLEDIVLEILESEQTTDEFINMKRELISKWNGVLALDDFGTGYNSEYALIEMNPRLIKIDHSLINGCDKDISRSNMIRDIVTSAGRRDIFVLAEGVETYDEMKTVISCGVDFLQGFYISKPVYEPAALSEQIKKEIRELAMPEKKGMEK